MISLFPDPSNHRGGNLGPSPWRIPTTVRPGTEFRENFIVDILLGNRYSNISHLKLFPDPSNHQGAALGPSPWRTPTSARPGTDFRAYFIEEIMLGIVELVIRHLFWTPLTSGWSSGTNPIAMEDPNISKARD